jgi:hypothetical protein
MAQGVRNSTAKRNGSFYWILQVLINAANRTSGLASPVTRLLPLENALTGHQVSITDSRCPVTRGNRIGRTVWRSALADDRELWERICRGDTTAFDVFHAVFCNVCNGCLGGTVATLLFTGLYGSRFFFDPHRPYQNLFIGNTLGLGSAVNHHMQTA